MKSFRSFILELYGEPEVSTFTHDDVEYDLNGVLRDTAKTQVETIKTSDVKWILKYDPLGPEDEERISNAILSAPILVVKWRGKLVCVDGDHRIAKAVRDNIEFLPARFVSQEILSRNKI